MKGIIDKAGVKKTGTLLLAFVCMFLSVNGFGKGEDEFNGSIVGKVITADGKPAQDVTVSVQELNKKTITDEDGIFTLYRLPEGEYEIEISFVGYETLHQRVRVTNQTVKLSFQLKISEEQLKEITVVSREKKLPISKLNIADRDLPQSIGVVQNRLIKDQQALRVGEIVRNVPGVSLVQTRYGVNETYGARGYVIGVTGGAGGASIYKDGLPVNIAGIPESVALESVEVIKGSTAFLFGNSSAGLVINMTTKKPKYYFGGVVSMNAGSNQQYKPVIDIYGPLSNNLAFRIVGSYENDKSYRDVVKTERTYINPSLMYTLGDKTTLVVQGEYLNAHLTPDGGVGLLDSGRVLTKEIPRSRFQNVLWAYNDVLRNAVSAELKHTFNDKFSLNFSSSYQHTDVDSYGAGNLNTARPNGVIARSLSRAHSIEKDIAAQLNIDGKFNIKNVENHFLAGVDFTRVATYNDGFQILNQNGSTLKTYDTINLLDPTMFVQRTDQPTAVKLATTTAPSNRAGIYVQDLISLTSKFKMYLGGRYSYQATIQTTIDSMATANKPSSITRGSAATTIYNVFSPKVGVVYEPSSSTSLYATYSNSFNTNSGVDVYGNALPASIINQYEAGIKNYFLKGRITSSVSIYRIINSHLAQQAEYKADGVTPNTDATVKSLTGETTSDGMEAGINANISDNFYFLAGYSYNNIRFTHTSGSKGSNIEGERLTNAPQHTANAALFYTFQKGVVKGFKLGASAFYTGSRLGGYNNTIGQSVSGSRLISLSDFTTVDATVGYTYRKFSLQCKLSNIFNTLNYLVHDNYSITPIAPRQFMSTITYRF